MPLTPSMIITTTHDLIWYSIVMAALSLRFTVVVLFSCISFTCAVRERTVKLLYMICLSFSKMIVMYRLVSLFALWDNIILTILH